jgi:hypothetical protein
MPRTDVVPWFLRKLDVDIVHLVTNNVVGGFYAVDGRHVKMKVRALRC